MSIIHKFIKPLTTLCLGVAIGVTCRDEIVSRFASNTKQIEHNIQANQVHSNLEGKDNLLGTNNDAESKDKAPKIEVCFTPPSDCGHLIANIINNAKSTIYMQAYGLTHPEIINALINAKKNGIDVKVLLDRSNLAQRYSGMKQLQEAGIEVTIDNVPGIAHNKVIIVDSMTVVTGSFNFTTSASTRNAENIIITEDQDIAKQYLQNWLYRKKSNTNK